jgi:Xaa-Pro aminopeptidase
MNSGPINSDLFSTNRERLKRLLPPGSLVILNANDVPPTNADGTLAMVPNSDLFYLTGVEQEHSILLLNPGAEDEKHREMLFLREPSHENELWEGHKLTKPEARELTGIQNIQWLAEFPRLFHRLMCACDHVYLNSNEHARAVIEVESRDARFILETMRRYPLHDYRRLAPLLYQLRAVKSESEIAFIRKACEITEAGFRRVLKFTKPGVREKDVEAEFAHEFICRDARFAYEPIIASGRNACCLHYNINSAVCQKGLTPEKKTKDWQKEAEQLMEKELVDLGLLTLREIKQQDPDQPAVKKYFMHGVGHSLGLGVHDVVAANQPIQAGWVMTVEPGIYIPEENFAVRLENDVLVTETSQVDLMASIPIEADEVEALAG